MQNIETKQIMVQCSAPGCKNSSTKGFLLKRFPRDPERRARWAKNIKKTNWEPTNNSYVCEVHFDDDQWESKRAERLKWNALPTIFHKRLKYTKRKQKSMSDVMPPIQQNLVYSLNQNQSQNQIVYVLRVEDYITDMKDPVDVNGEVKEMSVASSESCCDDKRDERFEFESEIIEEDLEKDKIIEELRKQVAEKDRCLLKYEKIICQMNSHLEKLKGRLKFWRDFSERDKFSLRKAKRIHKTLNS